MDFPIMNRKVHGKRLVYLDSAATAQKPKQVIKAVNDYYEKHCSNIHRGIHTLSEEATTAYETAREKAASFLDALSDEIIFTRGTTEAINLVAHSFVRPLLKKGDLIVLSEMEHHANLIPWQMVAKETGARLKFVRITKEGNLDLKHFEKLLKETPRFVSLVHVSNVLGTVSPVKKICSMAHAVGANILIDGAQAAPHEKVDVADMNCDFYVFSGHKALGPTGIGVLYAKQQIMEEMIPYQTGGGMIDSVTLEHTTFKSGPQKFEAGTPNIAGAIGLGAAIDYMDSYVMANINKEVDKLVSYAYKQLSKIPEITIYGPSERAALVAFNLEGIHAHDVSSILDEDGIAIRAGHHCCQPLMKILGVPATCRASFHIYNTKEDIDALVKSLKRAIKIFK